MIMILDVDVTAEGGIIKLIARESNPPPFEPFEPFEPACQRQAEPFEPYCTRGRIAALFLLFRCEAVGIVVI